MRRTLRPRWRLQRHGTTGALHQVAVAKATVHRSTPVLPLPSARASSSRRHHHRRSPTSVTPGSSQSQPFTIRSQTSSGSVDLEDVLVSAAGAQDTRATFGTSTDWLCVVRYSIPPPDREGNGPPPYICRSCPTTNVGCGCPWSLYIALVAAVCLPASARLTNSYVGFSVIVAASPRGLPGRSRARDS